MSTSSRRKSIAPSSLASNIPAPTVQKRTSRRASMAVMPAPQPPKMAEKRGRGRPASTATTTKTDVKSETSKKSMTEIKKVANDDSFVSGDAFDFAALESPQGPMTRSRRSSMFVGSKGSKTKRTALSTTLSKKRSKMDAVMETPNISKFSQPESIIESPEGEVSFKVVEMEVEAPTDISEEVPIEEPITEKTPEKPKRGRPAKTPVAENKENKKRVSVSAKKSGLKPVKVQAKVMISPIKKAALQMAFANQAINLKKTPPQTLKMKVANKTTANAGFPGTPQQTNPANLLKRNLKRKVDVKLDQKVQEIPQNSSPYTLLQGETENGSPVEMFTKMNNKPSKENITGTPAPMKKSGILQRLDQNATTPVIGSPDPHSTRRRGTPRNLRNTPMIDLKSEEASTPKLEMENAAVNKAMSKATTSALNEHIPTSPVKSTSQMITGDLGRMCSIM